MDPQSLFYSMDAKKITRLIHRGRCHYELLSIYELICWEGACSWKEHSDAPPHTLALHMLKCVGYMGT